MSVHFNPATEEPYLRLRAPHSNIIITPHRPDQIEDELPPRVDMLNDPRVALCLEGPPYPYLREHAEDWVKTQSEEMRPTVEALQSKLRGHPPSQVDLGVFDQCPFACIREVSQENSDGHPVSDVFIGDIGLKRYVFYEHPYGSDERAVAQKTNDALPAGDERIVWGLGDFLSPSHHGRGIMTHAMKTVIHDWGVPHMNMRDLRASAFVDNIGSLKVFEKNQFKQVSTLRDWAPVSGSRGGGWRSIVVVQWKREEKA